MRSSLRNLAVDVAETDENNFLTSHEADEELSRVLHFIPPVYLWLDALDTIAEVRSVDNYPYNLWR